MRRDAPSVAALTLLAALLAGCNIGSSHSFKLNVPYVQQDPGTVYCGQAAILMWRLYDGLSSVSQQQIANWMTTCSSTAYDAYRDVIRHFTDSGSDAFTDGSPGSGALQDEYFSRQITSIDSRVPVWVVIGFAHAGILNGGKWRDISGDLYQWDYTYIHDPDAGPNQYYDSQLWMDTNCFNGWCTQIVSYNASDAWYYNLNQWGYQVINSGGDGPRFRTPKY